MTYQLLQGNCVEVLKSLPSGIARTCVSSPPMTVPCLYGQHGRTSKMFWLFGKTCGFE